MFLRELDIVRCIIVVIIAIMIMGVFFIDFFPFELMPGRSIVFRVVPGITGRSIPFGVLRMFWLGPVMFPMPCGMVVTL